MAYHVIHRPDQLLQHNNARDLEAEGLAGTFIVQYSAPAHLALEAFIDQRLTNRTFESVEELREALKDWPTFYYEMHGSQPHKDWRQLYIDLGKDSFLSAATGGVGGDFVFALYEEVKERVA